MTEKPKKRTQGMNWIRKEKRLAIYLRDGMACAYCGSAVEDGIQLTLDHLHPYSLGGTNNPGNLVTCCMKCNSSRGARPVQDFADAVAKYVDVEAEKILAHIEDCRSREIDVKGAKELISRRGSWAAAMKA